MTDPMNPQQSPFIPVVCPNCSGRLQIDAQREKAFCPYCGTPFLVKRAHHHYHFPDAAIHADSVNIHKKSPVESVLNFVENQQTRAEAIRQQEKQEKERRKRARTAQTLLFFKKNQWLVWLLVLGFLGFQTVSWISGIGKIPAGLSSGEMKGQNYRAVMAHLDNAGFTSIRTQAVADLVVGFLARDGEVEQVSIGGDTYFSAKDKYAADTEILIIYHTFPTTPAAADATTEATDAIITAETHEEFAGLLTLQNPYDAKIRDFARTYAGKTIAIDGCTVSMTPHQEYTTRFDYLVLAGDFPAADIRGPYFCLTDINYYEIPFTGENIPETFGTGLNIRLTATISRFDEAAGLLHVRPVSIEIR